MSGDRGGTGTAFWLIMGLLFLAGATFGSFLNVCIYRMPVGKSLVWPESHCGNCFHPVGWDNIPIVGWLLVGGHCRHCGVKLSLQYPAVELMSALALPTGYWAWVVQRHEPLGVCATYEAMVLALIVVTFIDLRWRIIPDRIGYGMMIAGPVLSLVYPRLMETGLGDFARWSGSGWAGTTAGWLSENRHAGGLAASLMGMAAGGGIIWLIRWTGTKVFRKEAMGLGDVKLLAGVGGLLGWKAAGLTLLVGVMLGAVVGIMVWLKTRRRDIPFGPYLAAGTVAVMFFGNPMWQWYLGLMNMSGGEILK